MTIYMTETDKSQPGIPRLHDPGYIDKKSCPSGLTSPKKQLAFGCQGVKLSRMPLTLARCVFVVFCNCSHQFDRDTFCKFVTCVHVRPGMNALPWWHHAHYLHLWDSLTLLRRRSSWCSNLHHHAIVCGSSESPDSGHRGYCRIDFRQIYTLFALILKDRRNNNIFTHGLNFDASLCSILHPFIFADIDHSRADV